MKVEGVSSASDAGWLQGTGESPVPPFNDWHITQSCGCVKNQGWEPAGMSGGFLFAALTFAADFAARFQ